MEAIPKVIIDTDAGVDDAMAILMLLFAHRMKKIQILAILTVHGNTKVENVNINVFRILDTVQMTEIPVYAGASDGLVSKFIFHHPPYFGADGFGDVIKDKAPASLSLLRTENASLALIRLVEANPGKVILIAVGPLTNLAISLNISSEWSAMLKDIYVMGGNIEGVGNHSVSAEFNFLCDPEAAKVVLDRMKIPIKLAPWEGCLAPNISYEERDLLGRTDSASAKLLNLIEKNPSESRYKSWLTCDQLTTAWALDEHTLMLDEKYPSQQLVTKKSPYFATVELSGNHTRGQMVVDHLDKTNNTKNIISLKAVNKEKYLDYLRMAFK